MYFIFHLNLFVGTTELVYSRLNIPMDIPNDIAVYPMHNVAVYIPDRIAVYPGSKIAVNFSTNSKCKGYPGYLGEIVNWGSKNLIFLNKAISLTSFSEVSKRERRE